MSLFASLEPEQSTEVSSRDKQMMETKKRGPHPLSLRGVASQGFEKERLGEKTKIQKLAHEIQILNSNLKCKATVGHHLPDAPPTSSNRLQNAGS
jgi:hypothetical protein